MPEFWHRKHGQTGSNPFIMLICIIFHEQPLCQKVAFRPFVNCAPIHYYVFHQPWPEGDPSDCGFMNRLHQRCQTGSPIQNYDYTAYFFINTFNWALKKKADLLPRTAAPVLVNQHMWLLYARSNIFIQCASELYCILVIKCAILQSVQINKHLSLAL